MAVSERPVRFGSEADIDRVAANVRFGPEADIERDPTDVSFGLAADMTVSSRCDGVGTDVAASGREP